MTRLFALIFLLTNACVSIDGQFVDDDFTVERLRSRGLQVTKVQVSGVKLDSAKARQLTSLLKAAIRDERKDIKIHPSSRELNDGVLLKEIKSIGSLSEQSIGKLPKSPNYIVYSSVIADNVDKQDRVEKDDNGKVVTYIYSTQRKMTVTFKVYDPRAKKLVWSGDINKTLIKDKSYSEKEYLELKSESDGRETINAVGSLIKAVSGSKNQKNLVRNIDFYPPVESQRRVLQKIFQDFGDSLPDEGMFD